jgi:erythronate-4-phosphate dehydrogenase
MSLEALCRFFGMEVEFEITPPEGPSDYDPTRDSEWLKADPEKFEWFRGNYPIRRE